MIRSSRTVVLLLAGTAAASLAGLAAVSTGSAGAAGTAVPAAGGPSSPPAAALAPGPAAQLAAPAGGGRTTVPPGEDRDEERTAIPDAAASMPAVRVRGRVLRGGWSVEGWDLEFRTAGPDGPEVDWDFTDEEGRYEVLLPAASCFVTSPEDESWTARLDVPVGQESWTRDIELTDR
ncbi:MAG: hypothetical protein AB1726_16695 [Planctomycetota bacterium]